MSFVNDRSGTFPRFPWLSGQVDRLVRGLAWTALVGAAVAAVRAEVIRPELPAGVEVHSDIIYRRVGHRQMKLDIYVPTTPAPASGRPTVLAIHGGGWTGGNKNGYGRETALLARHGYVVVSASYRLSKPGQPSWPENLDDVREAVRWVRLHATEYGIDPNRIAAMGASAGGHLAALLGTYTDEPVTAQGLLASSQGGGPTANISARVQAVIDFYGPTDLRDMYTRIPAAIEPIRLLVGGTPDEMPARYDAASPVRHVSHDDPPILLLHGADDPMIPTSQAEMLASEFASAGVAHRLIIIPGARHGFGFHVDKRDLLPEILAFLSDVWNDKIQTP
jgi:acetyl esterase/lipase